MEHHLCFSFHNFSLEKLKLMKTKSLEKGKNESRKVKLSNLKDDNNKFILVAKRYTQTLVSIENIISMTGKLQKDLAIKSSSNPLS